MTPKKNPEDLLKVGRPTKYKEEYCQQIIEYFKNFKIVKINDEGNKEVQAPPSLSKFSESIDVSQDTLHEWKKVHPEFSEAFKRAKKVYEDIHVEGAILGLYNPFFSKLVMANRFDWAEKTEAKNEITTPSGIEITFKKSDGST